MHLTAGPPCGGDSTRGKFQRALRGTVEPEKFEAMRGTVSEPFEAGENGRVAVKVIDFRGNEVVRVVGLPGA